MKKLLLLFLLIALALSLVLLRSNRKPFPNPSANLTTPEASSSPLLNSVGAYDPETSGTRIVKGIAKQIGDNQIILEDEITFTVTVETEIFLAKSVSPPTGKSNTATGSAIRTTENPGTLQDIKVGDRIIVYLSKDVSTNEAESVYVLKYK